jgi:hypothetical protein
MRERGTGHATSFSLRSSSVENSRTWELALRARSSPARRRRNARQRGELMRGSHHEPVIGFGPRRTRPGIHPRRVAGLPRRRPVRRVRLTLTSGQRSHTHPDRIIKDPHIVVGSQRWAAVDSTGLEDGCPHLAEPSTQPSTLREIGDNQCPPPVDRTPVTTR